MFALKQSTAITVPFFAHDANGDGVTGIVNASWNKRISKNGAAFGDMTVTITEAENGWYFLSLSTAHTDTLGFLAISLSAAAAKRVNLLFRVDLRLLDDLSVDGSGRVSANTVQWAGATIAATSIPVGTAAGAAGGLLIAGSNAATTLASLTVSGTSTFTGNISAAAGITVTQSTTNSPGISVTGNGSGAGIRTNGGTTGQGLLCRGGATSGSGIEARGVTESGGIWAIGNGGGPGFTATGGDSGHGMKCVSGTNAGVVGLQVISQSTDSPAAEFVGFVTGAGILCKGGSTGPGLSCVGGVTSGAGISVTTTSGNGINVAPTAGHALNLAANGNNTHGLFATGGTGGTSDGIRAAAGTGGVDVRGNITGNVTGNLTGSVNSVTTGVTVTTNNDKTGYSLTQAFPANFADLAITVSTGLVSVGTNNDKTGYSLTQVFPANFADLAITAATGQVTVGTNNDKTGYSLANASITASTFATDAVNANALAADAVTEIQAGLATSAALATVQADTDDIQTRLPAALVGGRMDASVGAMATDSISAAALSSGAAEKIIRSVSGTVTSAPAATSFVDTARTEPDADYWVDAIVVFTNGPAAHQPRRISAFNAASDTITVDTAWTTAPETGNAYLILRTAMQQAAAGGGGGTDWTAGERQQIRDALGVDGSKVAATGGQVQTIKSKTDSLTFTTPNQLDVRLETWKGAVPNNLISGRVDVNAQVVGDKTGYSISQTFPANFADLAITASTGRVTVGSNNDKSGYSLVNGSIAAATFASNAIIDSVIAASAVTKIQNGLATASALATVQSDTDDIQTRLPAALVGGRLDVSVGAMASDSLSAAALSSAAIEKMIRSVAGTVTASPTANSFVDAARTEGDDDYWVDAIVVFTNGPAAHQPRRISAFNALADRITVERNWTTAPQSGNAYLILRTAMHPESTSDWSAGERAQIRDSLGVDGSKTAATGGQLQVVKTKTDSLTFTTAGQVDARLQSWKGVLPNDLIAGRVDANAQVVGDKSGYSLTQVFPANFADLAITPATGRVTVGTNIDKSGYSLTQVFPSNFADLAITSGTGRVTVGTNTDKTGYALSQVFPANFADLAITPSTGLVSVGTNNDKTGYALTQAFPSNFASLSITPAGLVSVDKTGYSLANGSIAAATFAVNAIDAAALAADAVAEIQTGLSTAANVTESRLILKDYIERLRAHHVGRGATIYVDPVNGNDSTGTGARSTPYATIGRAHTDAIDGNHDVIMLIAGGTLGQTVLDERPVISKRYVMVRGPGRDFLVEPTTNGDVFTITGEGSSLEGFQIRTNSTGSGNAVTVQADNVFLTELFIDFSRGDAIRVENAARWTRIVNNNIATAGQVGSGQGIHVGAGAKYTIIRGNRLIDITDDGILIDGNATDFTFVRDNVIARCQGFGVRIQQGTGAVVVDNRLLGNTSGAVSDNGTATILENNEQWAKAGATNDDLDDLAMLITAVQADTDDIQTRLPATLSSGRMRCQLEGADANSLTAAALAADAANEIADAVLSRSVSVVEATAAEHSLCTVVLATLESFVENDVWTINRTNGLTVHNVRDVLTDANALPITGVR